ncbi:MAG TPA: hypothetical protein VK150_09780 [Geothrix sp.]|nr:hypothetical protein [Geothrix sp.]
MHEQDRPVPQAEAPATAAPALSLAHPSQARSVRPTVRINLGFLDGLAYPRSPKEYQFYVSANRGSFTGWCKAPISGVPAEIWTLDHEQAKAHPYVQTMIALATEDLNENIRKAFEEVG